MSPDVRGGDDEGAVGLALLEFGEAGGEGAEDAGGDSDIVGCGGRFDVDGRHDTSIVSQRLRGWRRSTI